MNLLYGWLLLVMVVILAMVAAWPLRRRRRLLFVAAAYVPGMFVGFALAKFGVHLLGGGS